MCKIYIPGWSDRDDAFERESEILREDIPSWGEDADAEWTLGDRERRTGGRSLSMPGMVEGSVPPCLLMLLRMQRATCMWYSRVSKRKSISAGLT
jgi:hypothetical protein